MKYVTGKDQLSEKHLEVLEACDSLERLMWEKKSKILAELWTTSEGLQRDNPRYRRLQSRYFRAIERLEKIALYYGVSAIQSEILMIGTIGFLTVPNWAKRKYIKFTQADKNELSAARSGVVACLFRMLDQMPSTVYLRESRDALTHRTGFEIMQRDRVKEMADLAVWVEVKSGVGMYFAEYEMNDEMSIFTKILAGQKRPRLAPAPGDTVRVDTIGLKLYTDFNQCFIGREPRPIAKFYIFEVQQIDG